MSNNITRARGLRAAAKAAREWDTDQSGVCAGHWLSSDLDDDFDETKPVIGLPPGIG